MTHSLPDEICLFYDGFEAKSLDRPLGRLQSEAHGTLRSIYRTVRGRQLYTGYYTAFLYLKRGLEAAGKTVHVNNFAKARSMPDAPIGISGYRSVYDRVRLKNPAVFGPGFVPPPGQIETLADACNLQVVTLPSEWPCEIWRPTLGDKVYPMFAPIDHGAWPDLSGQAKTLDVIVYDKVRWNKDERAADLVQPIIRHLEARGLSYRVLRYGGHALTDFKKALGEAKSPLFLCEHETQGLAYQEALASNVPVLAWDDGVLVDPYQSKLAPPGLVVSSVPYFDDRCGMRFKSGCFEEVFEVFWPALGSFRPREYTLENLSFERSATHYLSLLERARDANS